MAECNHDCGSCSQNCGERTEPESMLAKLNELSHVKKVIGIVSGKGGVGKSLVTSLLAVTMQRRGFQAAVLDADVTGPSIPRAFGIKEKAQGSDIGIFPAKSKTGIEIMSVNLMLENDTDPVVWRGPIIAGVVKQFWTDVVWNDVDFMFVDMPPGTGDVPLTVFQSLPVDGVIVVTSPQELVGMIVEKATKMAALMEIPVLAYAENMSYYECPDCHARHKLFGESDIAAIAEAHGVDTVAEIPIDPKLAAGTDAGVIELFDGPWLDGIADKLTALLDE